jgi:hypothetical protein
VPVLREITERKLEQAVLAEVTAPDLEKLAAWLDAKADGGKPFARQIVPGLCTYDWEARGLAEACRDAARMILSNEADTAQVPRKDLRSILKAVSELGTFGRTTLENINWCKATLKKHLSEK